MKNFTVKTVKEYPKNLSICFSEGYCNLKCPMCQTFGENKKYHIKKDKEGKIFNLIRGEMDWGQAEKMLDELKGTNVVVAPSGQTELFAQKNYMLYLKALKKAGLKININTNGLLLNEERIKQLINLGIDGIYISFDAFTEETLKKVRGTEKLEKIKQVVFDFLKYRGDSFRPRVGVSFVIQEFNKDEKDDFIDYWIQYVDSVRIAKLHARGKDIDPDLVPEVRGPCQMMYENMFVHYNGDVSVCCWDSFGRTNVGNVFKEGVQGVWLGEKFQKMRYYHETGQVDKIPFCQECQDWPRYQFTEEKIEGNILIRKSALITYYNRIDRLETWRFGEGDYVRMNNPVLSKE